MRVLVCGGRTFKNRERLFAVLDALHARHPFSCLIEGEARGADLLAASWASERGVPLLAFPANWQRDGYAAGPIRNKKMLIEGKPDLVVGFPGGPGTANMLMQAALKGVQIKRITGDWLDE